MENGPPWRERLFAYLLFVGATALTGVLVLYLALFAHLASADVHPRGRGWLALFIPLLAIAGILLWRSRPRTRVPVPVKALAVFLALAVLLPGWQAYAWMRGPQMYVWTWLQPMEPVPGQPVGVLRTRASELVRARTDGLYLINSEGRSGWRLPAPEGTSVCELSRSAPEDTGIVAYRRGDGGGTGAGCGAQVAAVDLYSGRTLWSKDLAPGGGQAVAVVGGTALAAAEGALLGLDAREGRERWRIEIPQGCTVGAVDGAGDRILYVERCADGAARLTAADARTGARAWQSSLPPGLGPAGEVRIPSVQPVAVRVPDGVLLFDDSGHGRGTIPVSGPQEDLSSTDGDLLITPVQGKSPGLSAYSLTDGRRLWHTGLGGEQPRALARGKGTGEVDVLTARGGWTYLWRLDERTGRRREQPAVLRDMPLAARFKMYTDTPDGPTFVNLDPETNAPTALPTVFWMAPVLGW
ncbi:PQQ-binding-like beta-propeller repeat protein [Streptomyces sp. NBC_00320]|uniref:outer membrane protein assembly factor BamB family protein n=1 Tax=Streptomyces sp. NBC_00320 TaxID=2975711 RepID=UPI002253352F|nr:PQQ-binding-like beta-propeller repeat protein [Streptomyces sp. NBC_00320]MCX5149944.1 PQQ-binding-like beta-propeller repeat protein [Streptomyces sp. NBC_00320]